MDSNVIKSVKSFNTLTREVSSYNGKVFIDCTGDGWLGYFAGAEYRLGREASSEFSESNAPATADKITMSGCIMGSGVRLTTFLSADTGGPVSFTRPPWAREIFIINAGRRSLTSYRVGHWWCEHPGTVDDVWYQEYAWDELIKIAFSLWDFIKNKSEYVSEIRNYDLDVVPIYNAKRETRRLVGDYILNQKDCQAPTVFPDRIAHAGWSLDIHHPEGIFSGEGGCYDFDTIIPVCFIPLRCIYSKNIENLLFAGRCISVTHVALGTVRLQTTIASVGQAAGTAAAMCVIKNTTPRGIYQDHISELQYTLLRDDQCIKEMKNTNPDDLSLRAKVKASSTERDYSKKDVINGWDRTIWIH